MPRTSKYKWTAIPDGNMTLAEAREIILHTEKTKDQTSRKLTAEFKKDKEEDKTQPSTEQAPSETQQQPQPTQPSPDEEFLKTIEVMHKRSESLGDLSQV